MKETGSPKILFENLDLTPAQHILWKNLHTTGPGRPVQYNPEWDLRAIMIRQLEQIPYARASRGPSILGVYITGSGLPLRILSGGLNAGFGIGASLGRAWIMYAFM